MGTGHLILGKISDYLTGQVIADTHDERFRQAIAKLLVEEKGFDKSDIRSRHPLTLTVDGKTGLVYVDFIISINNQAKMMIMYAPGSLVTRQRPTLAAARIVYDHVIPVAVISNGLDAIVMDAVSGKTIGEGFFAIPNKHKLLAENAHATLQTISERQQAHEKRILFAMEVLTQQECHEFTCSL